MVFSPRRGTSSTAAESSGSSVSSSAAVTAGQTSTVAAIATSGGGGVGDHSHCALEGRACPDCCEEVHDIIEWWLELTHAYCGCTDGVFCKPICINNLCAFGTPTQACTDCINGQLGYNDRPGPCGELVIAACMDNPHCVAMNECLGTCPPI